ncbi:MAG TPA: hypothetical protein VGR06_05275 [Actinophytocola sp.]|jgi:hypothetical protein|uniref:hypothetical protein n=1 Tax=Actinophytocola sp. TaxID=1872138 RepID=UPI002DFE6489|nr:hypothetical protein [Actinophytocola sp.]
MDREQPEQSLVTVTLRGWGRLAWSGLLDGVVQCGDEGGGRGRIRRVAVGGQVDVPPVAPTIDTEAHPPKILLIRGQAELDVVDGIPDEYFQWNRTYQMTPEQRAEWEDGVKSLYDGMVRVVVEPTWAKLIDFETTLPTAIEELMQQQKQRQRA